MTTLKALATVIETTIIPSDESQEMLLAILRLIFEPNYETVKI